MDLRLIEASPDCVKLISRDGTISYMNKNGHCMLEIEPGTSLVGRPWASLWPEDSRRFVEAGIRDATAGRSSRFSAFCPTAKGSPKWWDVVLSPLTNDDGSLECILAISRDVTGQKQVERTLQESEQRFRALADSVPQLAWLADTTGAVFWYNQRWFDYTGRSFEEMRGLGWKTVQHPDHVERVLEKFLDSMRRGEEWEDVFPLLGADGEYRWFLSRAVPQRDANGRISSYCGTNTDITEQRNQSQRLRQLARIVDLSHEAILVWDLTDGILTWNRGCEELYGYSKAEAIGTNSHQLLRTAHPVSVPDFEKILLTQGSWSGELRHVAADGAEVWVESRQEVIRFGGRRLVLETNRDVTERRRADEIRNLLVAELNHRVKNTLAIVQSIATQTARSAHTIEDYVTSFNGRVQSLASAHTVLTDSDWVGASIRDLVMSQIMIHGDLGGRIVVSGDDVYLPPQTALQFTLVLHELATNAVKHGALSNDSGKIDISWSLSPGDPSQLEFFWRESGGPFPAGAPRRRGFGLNLIERSARMPNLKTQIEFGAGGVSAKFTAPLPKPGDQSTSDLFNPGKRLMVRGAGGSAGHRAVDRDRVLLVERDTRDTMLLEEILYDAGYVTLGPVATQGDVKRKVEQFICDLAIVDLDLGRAEAGASIGLLASRSVPVVLIGSVSRVAEMADLAARFPHLTKPLEPKSLLSQLAVSMAHRRKAVSDR